MIARYSRPPVQMLFYVILICLFIGELCEHQCRTYMHIIPAHSPVIVVSGIFIICLCVGYICFIACSAVEPCSGPCKLIIKAAPGCVETVCCGIARITLGVPGKLIQGFGVLKTQVAVALIYVFIYYGGNGEGSRCLSAYCRAGIGFRYLV